MPVTSRRYRAPRVFAVTAGLALLTAAGITAAAAEAPPPTAASETKAASPLGGRRDAVVAKLKEANLPGLTGYAVGIKSKSNGIGVTLIVGDGVAGTQDVENSVTALGLGTDVVVQSVTGAPSRSAGIDAGATLETDNADLCTTGFSLQVGAQHGFLTASHCFDETIPATDNTFDLDAGEADGTGYSYSGLVSGEDWAILTLDDSPDTNQAEPYVRYQAAGRLPVTGLMDPIEGQAICHWGRTTGYQCGDVTAEDVTVTILEKRDATGTLISPAYQLFRLFQHDICQEGGDSGAPIYALEEDSDDPDTENQVLAVGLESHAIKRGEKCMQAVGGGANVSWGTPLSETTAYTTDTNASIHIRTQSLDSDSDSNPDPGTTG